MSNKYRLIILLILLLAALFYNLGKVPLIEDEALRGLVALEMKYSNDFITPTTAGEYYFNKPPLYNWIILGFFSLSPDVNEFILRLPMVLSLLGFSLSLFFYLKRYFRKETVLLTLLFFITSGRMLFYESMHGLIDITFSWVVFFQIVTIYEYYRKSKFREMYLLSYLLAAIGFLMKGLPVVPFQGITLLVVLLMHRSFKTFFNRWHFAGIGVFVIITASYFLAYHLKNPGMLDDYLTTLFFQSSSRTLFSNSFMEGFLHLTTYPFQIIYHFLPWSLLVLLLFSKQVRSNLMSDDRQRFFLLAFIFNLIIYWMSPIFYPRYILMLLPLGLAPLTEQFLDNKHQFVLIFRKWFFRIIIIAAILLIPAILSLNFFNDFQIVDKLWLKTSILSLMIIFLIIRFYNDRQYKIYYMIAALLVARLAYSSIISVQRYHSNENIVIEESREVIDISGQEPLYTFFSPEHDQENYHGRIKHKYNAQFYLEIFKGEIIPVRTEMQHGVFYLISKKHLKYFDVDVYTEYNYHTDYKAKYLIKLKKKMAF